MNEELQIALSELLGKASNGIGAASDFLAAELPEVIRQLLMWHMSKSIFISLVLIVSIFPSIKLLKFFIKMDRENPYDMWGLGTAFAGCYFAVISIIIPMQIMDVIKIWIAPKVWILEYAAKLTN